MKSFSLLSIMFVIGFLFVFVLFTNCRKDPVSTNNLQSLSNGSKVKSGIESLAQVGLTQTRSATLVNYNMGNVLVTNYPVNIDGSAVTYDDDVYSKSKRLGGNSLSLIVLEGFGFDIPTTASIENIIVNARRFKTGRGSVREHRVRLVRHRNGLPDWWDEYGFDWYDPNNSIYIPAAEAGVSYSQSGSTPSGYQWTADMINHLYFGVLFATYPPEKGSAIIYYDHVEITVQYSLP